MKYKEFMTEAKLKRLSDKELIGSIQKLIDKKIVWIEKDDNIFKIKWKDQPSSIFLSKSPKDNPKTWQDGFIDIVNSGGFGITVWDGIPKELKSAIQNANVERRERRFDNGY